MFYRPIVAVQHLKPPEKPYDGPAAGCTGSSKLASAVSNAHPGEGRRKPGKAPAPGAEHFSVPRAA